MGLIHVLRMYLEVSPGPRVPLHEHVVRDCPEPGLQPPHARPGGGVGVDVVDERRLGPHVRPGGPDPSNGLLRHMGGMVAWDAVGLIVCGAEKTA